MQPPKMVGRERKLATLTAYLDDAIKRQGRCVFISGEAGIGKTRLVEEVKKVASSKGFRILYASCFFESLTPYLPFFEALGSGGMEHLFAEEAPRVEGVYLLTDAGLPIKGIRREETGLDPDSFPSLLTTAGNFVRNSLSTRTGVGPEGTLNILGHGEYRILIESGADANLVVILKGRENEFLINDMREVLRRVDETYGGVLKEWDGREARVSGIEDSLGPLITSGRYDGIDRGKEDPRARRSLLFENVSLGLTRGARTTPVLLCIEDLQWADPSTLALLHYVARSARGCRLLILGTYRPEDVATGPGRGHPFSERKRLMSREDLCEEMPVQRLSDESIPELVTSLLGDVDLSTDFSDRMSRETEGNPLFIIELVKLMIDEGVLMEDNGIWTLAKGLEEGYIPPKIYDVIVRRLDRLPNEEREVLDYAAVIGEEFTSDVLSRATDVDRVRLLKHLRELEQTHKLIHSFDARYKFDHTMTKEVLYGEMPTELRREYHSIVARSIEGVHEGKLDDVLGDLAFHYHRSRDLEKAVPYLRRAAEKARETFASREAIRFHSEALDLIGQEGDWLDQRLESLEDLGDVYELTGEYDNAIRAFEEIRGLSREKEATARIHRKVASVLEKRGEYDRALEELSKGAHILAQEETVELGRIVALEGGVHMRKADYDDALEHCRRALDIFEEHKGEAEDVADVSKSIGTVHWYRGDYDKALEYYERSLALREKIGDKRGIAMLLSNIGNVHAHGGEYDQALQHYAKSLEAAETIGDQRLIAVLFNNIGNVHAQRREDDRALQHYEKSLAIRERIGDQSGMATSLGNLGNVHRVAGEYDVALQHYERSLALRGKMGDLRGIVMLLNNIGNVHKDRREHDRALEYYEKTLDIAEKIGDQRSVAVLLSNVAEIYFKKGDLQRALDSCRRALVLSEEIGVKENVGTSRRIAGMIHREQGQWNMSIENFEQSLAVFKEIGMEKDLAESYHEFGVMWKAKGDNDRAEYYLNKSIAAFRKLG